MQHDLLRVSPRLGTVCRVINYALNEILFLSFLPAFLFYSFEPVVIGKAREAVKYFKYRLQFTRS